MTNETTAAKAPALWNPIALSNWSFFLTPVFGAYFATENYKAMDKTVEAKKSMDWFYTSIAVMMLGPLVGLMFGAGIGVAVWILAYLVNFAVWNFQVARRQNKEILAAYGKSYERQPWGKILAVGIAANIAWHFVIGLF